jgi:hypothetical protein
MGSRENSFAVFDAGISADRLYGFERFILQSLQSGQAKVTFLLKGHVLEGTSALARLPDTVLWLSVT